MNLRGSGEAEQRNVLMCMTVHNKGSTREA